MFDLLKKNIFLFTSGQQNLMDLSNFLFTQKPTETLVLALFWSPRPLNILRDHKAKHDEYRKQLQRHFSLFLSLGFALFVIISMFSATGSWTNYTSRKVTQRPVVLLHWLHLTTDLTPGRWTGPGVEWTANPLALLDHKFHLTVSPV